MTTDVLTRPNLNRFVAAYRKAGGRLELKFFEGVGEASVKKDPNSTASRACVEKVIDYMHRELH